MTAFDYAKPVATANRLIERYGQQGSVLHRSAPTGPAYDPNFGPEFDEDARFVIVGYSSKDIDGTRILATDKKALLAPGSMSLIPTTKCKLVEADLTTWDIIAVDTLRPAETTLLYTLQVRRG